MNNIMQEKNAFVYKKYVNTTYFNKTITFDNNKTYIY